MKKNIDAMNHPTKVKETIGERIYTIVVYLLLILISATIILPLLHIISGSFSDPMQLLTGNVSFWPKGFTTSMYEKVLKDASIWKGYLNTILYTVLGTLISVTLTACAAYPLSRKDLFGRNIFISLFIFTMFFNGGMIPTYLVIKSMGLLDTLWVLVLPCAVSTYNIILMMNFMKTLPEALSESAFIDGAGHFRTMFSIILPLCLPSLATISLFIVLQHWNAWFDGMIYINNMKLKPLQTYLSSVLIVDSGVENISLEDAMENVTADGANGAKIFCAILPIMCLYPFLQKHFAKGIVRGSVKE